MMKLRFLACLFLSSLALRAADNLPVLWAERSKTVVAVEFFVETETDRRPTVAYGTVIDTQGTIILPSATLSPRFTPSQFKDFKIYPAGQSNSGSGEYLGQDILTGWHFIRVEEKLRSALVPITAFAAKKNVEPAIAELVWGIGLRNKDEDFAAYLLSARIALVQSLPQRTAIAQQEVASPGLPIFNQAGEFVGLALNSFGQSFLQFSRADRGGAPVMLINVEESSAFQVASEVLPYLDRVPKNVFGRPVAWVGAYGLQPVDPEVAKFLKLEDQSAAVISEVLEGSPSEKAGLKPRDIILSLDGQTLPRLRPDRGVINYVEREFAKRAPGDTITVGVLREGERVEVKLQLGDEPKMMREAERKYFDKLGITAREFVYGDAVSRRVKTTETSGIVAHFVKPGSPVGVAGVQIDDWIKEIDGTEIKSYAAAIEKLAAIENDRERAEFVMLASRGGETAVLRVKLK